MKIKLVPVRSDESLHAFRVDNSLVLNGVSFDLSRVGEGDTLPRQAINSSWIAGDVERLNGELNLSLVLPNPWNYSQAQAFPEPLTDVANGLIPFPPPLPTVPPAEDVPYPYPDDPAIGDIDWSLLVTAAMKTAALAAAQLAQAKALLASKNAQATTQISRIQDRIDTIGYGIETGEATEEDEAEQAALLIILATWKAYKFALGKVTKQPGWHASAAWPVAPTIPIIIADPEARASETM